MHSSNLDMCAKSSLGEFERNHICQERSALLLQHAVCVLYYMYIYSFSTLPMCVCVFVCLYTDTHTDRHTHTHIKM